MNNELIDQIKNVLSLKEEEVKLFLSKFKLLELKKGDYFINEGQRNIKLGLIVKGCMLCYYNNDGEQVIDDFSMDHEFITDYYSYLTKSPAQKNVKCLEDTTLLIIDFKVLEEDFAAHPAFERIGRTMAEGLFIGAHQKAISLMIDSAETRYLKLISKRPDLPKRVVQYLIASYLNIKPETLSRIRKKI